MRKKTLSLIVTRKCNLNCRYCYVLNKRAESMSFDIAKTAIQQAALDAEGKFDFLEISFIGGEPLCEFPLLCRLADWVREVKFNVRHILYATTNGTLLDRETKSWFAAHKDEFVLGLSYDGMFASQDANRSSSNDLVDLDFFLNTWPSQALKMTIDEGSVNCLAKNMIALHERGAKITANIACGMPDWETNSWSEYAKQLSLLVEYYLAHPKLTPINLIADFDLIALVDPNVKIGRHCEAGTECYDAVDMDGRHYGCHLFSPLAICNADEGLSVDELLKASKHKCEGCLIEKQCSTCYGMNFKLYGDVLHREPNVCQAIKLQLKACCKWHLARLKKVSAGNYSADDHAIAKALLKLNELGFA